MAIIWYAQFIDGTVIKEIDDKGVEHDFLKILPKKKELSYFALIDNERTYGINLITGEFLIMGLPINIAKEVDGRLYDITNRKLNYAEGIIQYKVSEPISISNNGPVLAKAESHIIGYKVLLKDFKYNTQHGVVKIKNAQPLLNINAKTHRVSFSITLTVEKNNCLIKI